MTNVNEHDATATSSSSIQTHAKAEHAKLISLDSKESPIDLEVVFPAAGERFKRAMKPFGILCIFASFFLLVPIIHFFLPWILYATAVILGVKTFLEPKLIRSAEAPCPVCSKPVVFKDAAYRAKSKLVCEHCRNQLRLIIENA